MADKRREKRRRNLTQAVSLSSLGAEFDEGLCSQNSSLHSPVSTPESEKLHSLEGEEVDNQSFWGPRNSDECQRALLKERLNESIFEASDAEWKTPGGELEETFRGVRAYRVGTGDLLVSF